MADEHLRESRGPGMPGPYKPPGNRIVFF